MFRGECRVNYRKGILEGIHVQIEAKKKKDNSQIAEIFWKPGFADDEMRCFDDEILWKADSTYNWFVDELIPKVIFENLPIYKKIIYGDYGNKKFRKMYISEEI